MSDICFVFASAAEKNADKIVGKYLKDIDYDIQFLSSGSKDKILKKDIDLEMSVLDDYKLVCPIGADALKYVTGITGITKYNGVHLEKKYMPIVHPNMAIVKPQMEDEIKKAFSRILPILNNEDSGKQIDKDYKHIETVAELDEYRDQLEAAKTLVVDIETTSVSPHTGSILGIALSTKPNQGLYVSIDVVNNLYTYFQELFNDRKCIFHNAKFDMGFMEYELKLSFPDWEDTMLLHYCLEESVGTHGLKPLALRFTDLGDYERELDEYKKSWARRNKVKLADFNYGMLPADILAPYACKDADATFQLYGKFKPLVENSGEFTRLYENILKPATHAMKRLEKNGGPINIEQVTWLAEQYQIDVEECLAEISQHEAVQRFERVYEKTFNPNSTAQLRDLFFNILKLKPTKKTDTGAWSVDKEVLTNLNHPLSEAILELREKTKMAGTYISNIKNGVDKDGRLRSGFNIHGTTSGRLSSSGNLNYQNIPRDNKDIKKLFKARPGYKIIQCDLGTAEVYYAAMLSGDKFLQEAFINKLDFHSYVAKNMFKLTCEVGEVKDLYPDLRQYSKAITFGILYGAGPSKIAETANITIPEAKEFITKYFREAKTLKRWIDSSLN